MSVRERDERSREALAELCETYWPAIYAYARRRGHAPEEAEDLTQGFFVKLLEKDYVSQADRMRGRFRTFLLTSFTHYLANEWDFQRAQKRGGRFHVLSWDFEGLERRVRIQVSDGETPEHAYSRYWAAGVVRRVLDRLRLAMEAAGKAEQFRLLQPRLTESEAPQPYRQVAARLGMTEEAARRATHRMKGRFKALLQQEVAETVGSEDEVFDEIRFLLRSFER